MDGLRIVLFGYQFRIEFWKDLVCYEAVRNGRREFVREQRHRLLFKRRRLIYRSSDVSK